MLTEHLEAQRCDVPSGQPLHPIVLTPAKAALRTLLSVHGAPIGIDRPVVDAMVAHAQMRLGPGMIMLGSGRHEPPSPWDAVAQGIYVFVPDVDAHYARARDAGAEIVSELRETDYGSREYSVCDPEGHLWAFGTYDPWK